MADLLGDLQNFQSMVRSELLGTISKEEDQKASRTDVTGRWMGYSEDGYGLVEYLGDVYKCVLLSSTCRPKHSLVNLRRTARGNFADWQ